MVIVYVWLPKAVRDGAGHKVQYNVGHASMKVGDRDYVSWWPDQAAGPFDNFNPIRNKSYTSDCADEGGTPDFSVSHQRA